MFPTKQRNDGKQVDTAQGVDTAQIVDTASMCIQPDLDTHEIVNLSTLGLTREPGQLVGQGAGLVIEQLRVRIPARAAGEFSSPE